MASETAQLPAEQQAQEASSQTKKSSNPTLADRLNPLSNYHKGKRAEKRELKNIALREAKSYQESRVAEITAENMLKGMLVGALSNVTETFGAEWLRKVRIYRAMKRGDASGHAIRFVTKDFLKEAVKLAPHLRKEAKAREAKAVAKASEATKAQEMLQSLAGGTDAVISQEVHKSGREPVMKLCQDLLAPQLLGKNLSAEQKLAAAKQLFDTFPNNPALNGLTPEQLVAAFDTIAATMKANKVEANVNDLTKLDKAFDNLITKGKDKKALEQLARLQGMNIINKLPYAKGIALGLVGITMATNPLAALAIGAGFTAVIAIHKLRVDQAMRRIDAERGQVNIRLKKDASQVEGGFMQAVTRLGNVMNVDWDKFGFENKLGIRDIFTNKDVKSAMISRVTLGLIGNAAALGFGWLSAQTPLGAVEHAAIDGAGHLKDSLIKDVFGDRTPLPLMAGYAIPDADNPTGHPTGETPTVATLDHDLHKFLTDKMAVGPNANQDNSDVLQQDRGQIYQDVHSLNVLNNDPQLEKDLDAFFKGGGTQDGADKLLQEIAHKQLEISATQADGNIAKVIHDITTGQFGQDGKGGDFQDHINSLHDSLKDIKLTDGSSAEDKFNKAFAEWQNPDPKVSAQGLADLQELQKQLGQLEPPPPPPLTESQVLEAQADSLANYAGSEWDKFLYGDFADKLGHLVHAGVAKVGEGFSRADAGIEGHFEQNPISNPFDQHTTSGGAAAGTGAGAAAHETMANGTGGGSHEFPGLNPAEMGLDKTHIEFNGDTLHHDWQHLFTVPVKIDDHGNIITDTSSDAWKNGHWGIQLQGNEADAAHPGLIGIQTSQGMIYVQNGTILSPDVTVPPLHAFSDPAGMHAIDINGAQLAHYEGLNDTNISNFYVLNDLVKQVTPGHHIDAHSGSYPTQNGWTTTDSQDRDFTKDVYYHDALVKALNQYNADHGTHIELTKGGLFADRLMFVYKGDDGQVHAIASMHFFTGAHGSGSVNALVPGSGPGFSDDGEHFTGAAKWWDDVTDAGIGKLPADWEGFKEGVDTGTDLIWTGMQFVEDYPGVAVAVGLAMFAYNTSRGWRDAGKLINNQLSAGRILWTFGKVGGGTAVLTALQPLLALTAAGYPLGSLARVIRNRNNPSARNITSGGPNDPSSRPPSGASSTAGSTQNGQTLNGGRQTPRPAGGRSANVLGANRQPVQDAFANALQATTPDARSESATKLANAINAAHAARGDTTKITPEQADALVDAIRGVRPGSEAGVAQQLVDKDLKGLDLSDPVHAAAVGNMFSRGSGSEQLPQAIQRAAIVKKEKGAGGTIAQQIERAQKAMHEAVDGGVAQNPELTPKQAVKEVQAIQAGYSQDQLEVNGLHGANIEPAFANQPNEIRAVVAAAGDNRADAIARITAALKAGNAIPTKGQPLGVDNINDVVQALRSGFAETDLLGETPEEVDANVLTAAQKVYDKQQPLIDAVQKALKAPVPEYTGDQLQQEVPDAQPEPEPEMINEAERKKALLDQYQNLQDAYEAYLQSSLTPDKDAEKLDEAVQNFNMALTVEVHQVPSLFTEPEPESVIEARADYFHAVTMDLLQKHEDLLKLAQDQTKKAEYQKQLRETYSKTPFSEFLPETQEAFLNYARLLVEAATGEHIDVSSASNDASSTTPESAPEPIRDSDRDSLKKVAGDFMEAQRNYDSKDPDAIKNLNNAYANSILWLNRLKHGFTPEIQREYESYREALKSYAEHKNSAVAHEIANLNADTSLTHELLEERINGELGKIAFVGPEENSPDSAHLSDALRDKFTALIQKAADLHPGAASQEPQAMSGAPDTASTPAVTLTGTGDTDPHHVALDVDAAYQEKMQEYATASQSLAPKLAQELKDRGISSESAVHLLSYFGNTAFTKLLVDQLKSLQVDLPADIEAKLREQNPLGAGRDLPIFSNLSSDEQVVFLAVMPNENVRSEFIKIARDPSLIAFMAKAKGRYEVAADWLIDDAVVQRAEEMHNLLYGKSGSARPDTEKVPAASAVVQRPGQDTDGRAASVDAKDVQLVTDMQGEKSWQEQAGDLYKEYALAEASLDEDAQHKAYVDMIDFASGVQQPNSEFPQAIQDAAKEFIDWVSEVVYDNDSTLAEEFDLLEAEGNSPSELDARMRHEQKVLEKAKELPLSLLSDDAKSSLQELVDELQKVGGDISDSTHTGVVEASTMSGDINLDKSADVDATRLQLASLITSTPMETVSDAEVGSDSIGHVKDEMQRVFADGINGVTDETLGEQFRAFTQLVDGAAHLQNPTDRTNALFALRTAFGLPADLEKAQHNELFARAIMNLEKQQPTGNTQVEHMMDERVRIQGLLRDAEKPEKIKEYAGQIQNIQQVQRAITQAFLSHELSVPADVANTLDNANGTGTILYDAGMSQDPKQAEQALQLLTDTAALPDGTTITIPSPEQFLKDFRAYVLEGEGGVVQTGQNKDGKAEYVFVKTDHTDGDVDALQDQLKPRLNNALKLDYASAQATQTLDRSEMATYKQPTLGPDQYDTQRADALADTDEEVTAQTFAREVARARELYNTVSMSHFVIEPIVNAINRNSKIVDDMDEGVRLLSDEDEFMFEFENRYHYPLRPDRFKEEFLIMRDLLHNVKVGELANELGARKTGKENSLVAEGFLFRLDGLMQRLQVVGDGEELVGLVPLQLFAPSEELFNAYIQKRYKGIRMNPATTNLLKEMRKRFLTLEDNNAPTQALYGDLRQFERYLKRLSGEPEHIRANPEEQVKHA